MTGPDATASPPAATIRLRGLRATGSDGTTLLDGIDLDLPAASSTVLIGPSGAGKTTLLRLIAGLMAPAAGEVEFDGAVASCANELRVPPGQRKAGYLPQDAGLWDHLRAVTHLELVLAAAQPGTPRREIRRQAAGWLERLHLQERGGQRAGRLSGGERRRLALGRALAIGPRVMLLDEAFSGLDYALRDEMLDALREFRAGHACTLVAVTHVREETVQLADRVVVLEAGRVTADGPPGDPAAFGENAFARRFFG